MAAQRHYKLDFTSMYLVVIGDQPKYEPYMNLCSSIGETCGSMDVRELKYLTRRLMRCLNIKEAGRTVRAKRPVQQRKVDICPKCKGEGWVRCRNNGNYSEDCSKCGGSGKRSTVA